MPPGIRIRPIATRDIDALLPLVEQYWRFESIDGFDHARIAGLLRRVVEDPRLGQGWLATAGGTPAGYLLAVYVFSLEHQGLTAEIDEFFVAPGYRNLGIGGLLISAAEEEFRARRCTNVSLQLGRRNEAARRFYQRRGYAGREGFDLIDKMLTGENA